MYGLAAISPVIDRLRQELQANNVPPGQEGQYFRSQNRPLDPHLLFLIQANQIERSRQPQQQPVMSSVLQDKIQSAMQQAQPQPLPPPAVMQAMRAQAQQAPAQMPQQGGIAPLPFNNPGYASGGIVAFNGEDNNQDVESEDEDEDKKTVDIPDLATAERARGLALAEYNRDYEKQYEKAYAPVRVLEQQEATRLAAIPQQLEREKAEQRRAAVWRALQSMGGHRTAAQALTAAGESLGTDLPRISELYRERSNAADKATFDLKKAEALQKAGFVVEGQKLKQAALKQLIAAESAVAAAKRAAATAAGKVPDWKAKLMNEIGDLEDKRDTLDPKSNEFKAVQKKIDTRYARLRRPEVEKISAPSVVAAGIGAASRERIAAATDQTKRDIANLNADVQNGKTRTDAAVKLLDTKRKKLADQLAPEILSGRIKPEEGSKESDLLKSYNLLTEEIDRYMAGLTADVPPGIRRPAPGAATSQNGIQIDWAPKPK